MVTSSPDVAGTDPDMHREIVETVETVRRFVAREVVPVAARADAQPRTRGLLARARSA